MFSSVQLHFFDHIFRYFSICHVSAYVLCVCLCLGEGVCVWRVVPYLQVHDVRSWLRRLKHSQHSLIWTITRERHNINNYVGYMENYAMFYDK